MDRADLLVVGAGIVGLATARAVVRAHPDQTVVVAEKEPAVAAHQSGRNSGVIHAGVYYQPGSDKARLCRAGRTSMVEYCRAHAIDHEVCGKLVVALDDDERRRLAELERRCAANGVRAVTVGAERLREIEPHAAGIAALHVLDTGIVDYAQVCRVLAAEIEEAAAALQALAASFAPATDAAVEVAYGFNTEEDTLTQLLALNQSIAEQERSGLTEPRRPGNEGLPGTKRTSSRIEPPIRL